MIEPRGSYLVYEETTVHTTPITPVKLLAFGKFWWLTKRFWKPIDMIIYQSSCPDGDWTRCETTDEFAKEP